MGAFQPYLGWLIDEFPGKLVEICDVPRVSLEERPPELKLGERAEHEPADHDHEGGEEAREGEVALDLNTG